MGIKETKVVSHTEKRAVLDRKSAGSESTSYSITLVVNAEDIGIQETDLGRISAIPVITQYRDNANHVGVKVHSESGLLGPGMTRVVPVGESGYGSQQLPEKKSQRNNSTTTFELTVQVVGDITKQLKNKPMQ